jgi:hypothetical protein
MDALTIALRLPGAVTGAFSKLELFTETVSSYYFQRVHFLGR